MASLALAFDILARDQGASKTFHSVGEAAQRTGRKVDGASSASAGFGSTLKKAMGVAGAAITAAAGVAAVGMTAAVKSASNLGESINAVNVVFGDAADAVLKLSENSAKAVGLSKSEFNGLAVQFSSFADRVGGPRGPAGVIEDITTRAADFASVMNLDVAEAARVFQSALSGEQEPIKKFGIDLSAASVEAYAVANGIGEVGRELTETEKVQARYGLLMEATAKTAGDFANTSDSLANKQRILAARFEDIKASAGEVLLPVLENLAGFIDDNVMPAVEDFIQGFKDGTGAGGELADKLEWIRDKAGEVGQWFGENVLPKLQAFGDWISETGLPAVQEFGEGLKAWFSDKLAEVRTQLEDTESPLSRVRDFIVDTFQPAFEKLNEVWEEKVLPNLAELRDAFERNRPAIEKVVQVVGVIIGAMVALQMKIQGAVLPILIELAGFLIGALADGIGVALDWMTKMYEAGESIGRWMRDARDKAGEFIDKIKDFKLPDWVQKLADLISGIASNVGKAASGIGGWLSGLIGDGPGRNAGGAAGSTLARVRSVLPAGAVITSTYRTPAQNRAVGGVPGSYHTDANNPAVDIAGSRAAMDAVYARLAAMGGWRELLYKTAGHWDHVHVAHDGGRVSASWPTLPGLRPDERPVVAQIGEDIIPRGAGRGDVTVVVKADAGLAYEYALEVGRQARRGVEDAMVVAGMG